MTPFRGIIWQAKLSLFQKCFYRCKEDIWSLFDLVFSSYTKPQMTRDLFIFYARLVPNHPPHPPPQTPTLFFKTRFCLQNNSTNAGFSLTLEGACSLALPAEWSALQFSSYSGRSLSNLQHCIAAASDSCAGVTFPSDRAWPRRMAGLGFHTHPPPLASVFVDGAWM